MEENEPNEWDADMVAALADIIIIHADGVRNALTLRVTCACDPDKEIFDPAWQFLDSAGEPLPERRRSINLTGCDREDDPGDAAGDMRSSAISSAVKPRP